MYFFRSMSCVHLEVDLILEPLAFTLLGSSYPHRIFVESVIEDRNNGKMLGGVGNIVEVDETHFEKRKKERTKEAIK